MSERPKGVSKEAEQLGNGNWCLRTKSQETIWDSQGAKIRISNLKGGAYTRCYLYHACGNASINFAKGTGEAVRYKTAEAAPDDDGFPRFPSNETSKVMFELTNVDAKQGTYAIANERFFDTNGVELSGSGAPPSAPVEGAVLLVGDTNYWFVGRMDNDGRPLGTCRYHTPDGTLRYELQADESGQPVSLTVFGDGAPCFRHRYTEQHLWFVDDGEESELRLSEESLWLKTQGAEHRLVFAETMTAEAFCEGFAPFVQVFSQWSDLSIVGVPEVPMRCAEPKVAVILEINGGEEVVLVEEAGAHEGRVFINYHDEGLYSIEDLEDEYEEYGSLEDKDALIAELPFAENPLADSLVEFARSLRVQDAHLPALLELKPA
ncbi:MAG: hypothetical protein AAF645_18030 [Myxococcota bacterium]